METKLIIIILIAFLLSGCGIAHAKTNAKIEVSSYSEEVIELKETYNLDILCDIGNIQVYTWKRDDIKFEITRRVSGTYKKELLSEKLEKFEIDINSDDNTVFLQSRYNGGNKDALSVVVDYTIYMPKSIDYMNYKVDEGNIKLFDDMHGILKADLNNADIEINRFDGILNIIGNEGNVRVSSGKISGNSEVKKNIGNISIKSEFDENGEYNIYTGLGHIDLLSRNDSNVVFETVGELIINEFEENGCEGFITGSEAKPGKVRLKSEMGKISIRKYQ